MTTPASQSPQSEAIAVANGYLSIAQQVMTLYSQMKSLDAQAVDNNVANIIAQMQTVPIHLDGSLGTVNDAAPVQTNPINTTVYPTLNRPVSMSQLVQVKTILDGIVAYIEGQAVTTQAGARAILNAVIGS